MGGAGGSGEGWGRGMEYGGGGGGLPGLTETRVMRRKHWG